MFTTIAIVIIASALLVAVGYFWPRGLRKVPNPNPHSAADAEYHLVYISNVPHAFTEEQVAVAADRARRLRLS